MIPYYGEDNNGFGQAFQNQFKRSLGIPGEPPVGGGGGPMPVPDGGPHWRNGGGFVSPGNPTGSDDFGANSMTRAREDYLRNNPQGPAGPGAPDALGGGFLGGPVGDQNTGGGGGPMPVPTGGPNWRTPSPVGDQPTGGGGGPMPVPPPWVRFGGKPEDYGVTMEFGGPGAINPPGMNPNDLRNFYNPPAPPPAGPNPQASPSPNWGTGFNGGGLGAGLNPFVQVPRFGQVAISPFAPKRGGLGGQDNAPPPPMARPFGGPALPKRGGLGGQDNAPPPPAVNPGMGGGAQRLGTPFQFNPQPKQNGWNWGDMSNIYRRRF